MAALSASGSSSGSAAADVRGRTSTLKTMLHFVGKTPIRCDDHTGPSEHGDGEVVAEEVRRQRQLKRRARSPSVTAMAANASRGAALPSGLEATEVAGIALPPAAVGDLLQVVEFLAAFGEVVGVGPGEAQAMVQELEHAGAARRGAQSALVRVHQKLLAAVCRPSASTKGPTAANVADQGAWMQLLRRHLEAAPCPPGGWSRPAAMAATTTPTLANAENSGLGTAPLFAEAVGDGGGGGGGDDDVARVARHLGEGPSGYGLLALEEKAALLRMLCEDALATEAFRSCINAAVQEQDKLRKRLLGQRREMKENMAKGRPMELTKFVHSGGVREGSSTMSLKEQKDLVTLKQRAAPPKAAAVDMVRTRAAHRDDQGRSFWQLRGFRDSSELLMQNLRHDFEEGSATVVERWSSFSKEQQPAVEAFFSAVKLANKKKRRRMVMPPASSCLGGHVLGVGSTAARYLGCSC
eukprot:SM000199S05426  [mRNA]  locus=s199:193063:195757:- [translate_table: standard]